MCGSADRHLVDRCRDCGAVLEEYDEDTLGLAVVVLSMFIHLSPDLAAPLLLDIMQSVGRYGAALISSPLVCICPSLYSTLYTNSFLLQ